MLRLKALIIFSVAVSKYATYETIPPNTTPTAASEDTAEETQHAICKVITQEIQTSANATIKRQLKGVCTTRQIERRFRHLERKLLQELNQIKAMLTNDRSVTTKTDYDYFNYEDENIAEKSLSEDGNIISVTETMTRDSSWTRTEIGRLNNTMYMLKGQKVYSYYWEVANIRPILLKKGIHVRSPDFFVLGHQLCIQLYPNHFDSSYLGLQLRPSSNFLKKHKFTILEPFDGSKDINSQTLGGISNYEGIYKVPYAKLEERNYLHDDTLIIKLTIYVNS